MSIESVSRLLLLSELHSATPLKARCIDYITNNASKIMATEGWKVVAANLELVLELFRNFVIKHDCD